MAVDGAGLGPRLAGKVAFITGAGMGMGREAAVLFAEHGARIGVADINKAAAEETVALVERAGGQAVAVAGDVAVEADVQRMIDETARRFGGAPDPLQQRGRPLEGPRPLGAGDGRRLVGARHGRQPEVRLLGDQARHPAPPEGGRRVDRQRGLGVGPGRLHARPGRLHLGEGRAHLPDQVARHPVREGPDPLQHHPSRDRGHAAPGALPERRHPEGVRDRASRSGGSRSRGRSRSPRSSSPRTSRRS